MAPPKAANGIWQKGPRVPRILPLTIGVEAMVSQSGRSPYDGVPVDRWRAKTQELVTAHPLDPREIVDVVLGSWDAILTTRIGDRAQIGVHIRPRPQVMGTFLHEIIPLEYGDRYPGVWRREETPDEKDLVYVPDGRLSIEIKTSSSRYQVFGNRSYAQAGSSTRKDKSGYFLTINFEKFARSSNSLPKVRLIHFGWLDESDWIGQTAPTGQQARLDRSIYGSKLIGIFSA